MDIFPYKDKKDQIFFGAWGIPQDEPQWIDTHQDSKMERELENERQDKLERARIMQEYAAKPKWVPKLYRGKDEKQEGGI